MQGHITGSKNTEVPVQGHDPFIIVEGQGGTISLNLLPGEVDGDHRLFETLICLPGEFAVKSMTRTDVNLVS